ncbi:class I SAM-dependent methyltransferase [Micromonospora sp. SL1-18]|uniref:class I SAM-dependent methyltransferase n=1 Tax=Micromonospora sp. SL1-18 TaxID=3399128 RepID=UPI003A4E1F8D
MQVTVLDVDPVLLALADAALPTGTRTVCADIASPDWMSLAGGPFDLVLAIMTVHYLPEQRLWDWYAEARKVLRPYGLLLVADKCAAGPAGVRAHTVIAASSNSTGVTAVLRDGHRAALPRRKPERRTSVAPVEPYQVDEVVTLSRQYDRRPD